MTTRRRALGLIGSALPAWAFVAHARPQQLSSTVGVEDPSIRIVENVWIPMPDGSRLAARLFLPHTAAQVPTGAVLEYLPYRKRDAYRYRDDVAGPFLAKAGIALLRVDIRG